MVIDIKIKKVSQYCHNGVSCWTQKKSESQPASWKTISYAFHGSFSREQIVSKHDINHFGGCQDILESDHLFFAKCNERKRERAIKSNEKRAKERQKDMQRETKSSTQHKNVLNSEKSFQNFSKKIDYLPFGLVGCSVHFSIIFVRLERHNGMFNLSHNIHDS